MHTAVFSDASADPSVRRYHINTDFFVVVLFFSGGKTLLFKVNVDF